MILASLYEDDGRGLVACCDCAEWYGDARRLALGHGVDGRLLRLEPRHRASRLLDHVLDVDDHRLRLWVVQHQFLRHLLLADCLLRVYPQFGWGLNDKVCRKITNKNVIKKEFCNTIWLFDKFCGSSLQNSTYNVIIKHFYWKGLAGLPRSRI